MAKGKGCCKAVSDNMPRDTESTTVSRDVQWKVLQVLAVLCYIELLVVVDESDYATSNSSVLLP